MVQVSLFALFLLCVTNILSDQDNIHVVNTSGILLDKESNITANDLEWEELLKQARLIRETIQDSSNSDENVSSDEWEKILRYKISSESIEENNDDPNVGHDVFDVPVLPAYDDINYNDSVNEPFEIQYTTINENVPASGSSEQFHKTIFLDDIHDKQVNFKSLTENKRPSSHQSSLAFVFDSTGSMWDDLQQLKSGAEKIMLAMEDRDDNPIFNYVFVPFHDPKVGPVTVTRDREVILKKLDEIDVYGGGTCPEMSLGGIRLAVDASLPNSFVYVFTDATAFDHYLVDDLINEILRKQIQVVFVLTGDCNNRTVPNYTVYKKIAAASSGQIFHLDKEEVGQVLDFVRDTLDSRRVNLLSVSNLPAFNQTPHNINVDGSLDQLTIAVSGENPKINVTNPDGEHITNPPKIKNILDLENVKVLNVAEPKTGNWTFSVTSDSDHSLRLTGLTDLRFKHGFSVKKTKDMDETNYRPLHGVKNYLFLQPIDESQLGKVLNVNLIGLDGEQLKTNIPMYLVPDTNNIYISDKFRIPMPFFNIAINGVDKDGNIFTRTTTTAIKSQFPDPPYVTVTSNKVYHPINQPLNLSCHVESLIPVTVKWYKNERIISDPEVKEQTGWFYWHDIYPTIHSDGDYKCEATNELGTTSEQIQLIMIAPPILKKSNRTQLIVQPKQSVSIDCYTLSGNPSPSIEWLKNGQQITDGELLLNGTLKIMKIDEINSGMYQCIASNLAGVDSFNLDIIVARAPSFNDNNVNEEINLKQGSRVEFKCQPESIPKSNIKWLKNGDELMETDGALDFDNSTLYLKNIDIKDSGLFMCVATNLIGVANKSWHLNVIVPASIEQVDSKVNPKIDEFVTLPCYASGHPTPDIIWTKNSQLIPNIELKGPHHFSFVANLDSNGIYECIATNIGGVAKQEWHVDVFIPPSITPLEKEYFTVKSLENKLKLICNVSGNPKPDVKWLRNDDYLSSSAFIKIKENSLVLLKFDLDTSGLYKCEANNTLGTVSKQYQVDVLVPPKIIHFNHPNESVYEHDNLTMFCSVVGVPKPTIKWFKNKQLIDRIEFNDVNLNHSGVYMCQAENSEGVDTRSYNLTVLGAPLALSDSSQPVQVVEGDTIYLECPIRQGFPPSRIDWFKLVSNEEIPLDVNTDRFKLENVNRFDSGNYICSANNGIGAITAPIELRVLYPPQFQNKTDDQPIKIVKNIYDNNIVKLNCNVDSYPKSKIFWYLNNTIISKNYELILNNVSRDDRYNIYSCKAVNDVGSDFLTYSIDIQEPPTILNENNLELKILKHNAVNISCEATGIPEPIIKWKRFNKTGEIVTSDKNLLIKSMDYIHDDIFVCEATNSAGTAQKIVKLKMLVPPKIPAFTPEHSISVNETEKFKLNCIVESIPRAQLTWSKDNIKLTEENFQREFTARSQPVESNPNLTKYTLTAYDVTTSLSGVYRCTAHNNLGHDHVEFNVTVLAPPKLLDPITNSTKIDLIENNDVLLNCSLDLGNPPASVVWIKNNDTIQINETVLKLSNVLENSSGLYKCVATNILGNAEQLFNVDVSVPPKSLDDSIIPVSVITGDVLKLYCDITGSPKPSVMWLKDSSELTKVKADTELLIVPNITKSDSGIYTCVGVNRAGSTTIQFTVDILEPPHFKDNLPSIQNINASLEIGFVLHCDIDGYPTPNITWEKEGHPLLQQTPNNITYFISNDGTSLQVTNPLLSDAGKYICQAKNLAGLLQRQFFVSIKVFAKWSKWSDWGSCSATCDDGIRLRTRVCDYPKEFINETVSIDISQCSGPDTEQQICNLQQCAIDGGWSLWSDWSTCSASCGFGTVSRFRYCNSPTPQFGGAQCNGSGIETKSCILKQCPLDGYWSDWSSWSSCSSSCGEGVRTRYRKCDNPKPLYGGKDCNGNAIETQLCHLESCPVNGGWSDWESWTPCSVTCGLGRRSRKRYCNNPVPEFGGKYCTGENHMIKGCVIQPCFLKSANIHLTGILNGNDINDNLIADISNDGPAQIVRLNGKDKLHNKNGWFPYLTFLVTPVTLNSVYPHDDELNNEPNSLNDLGNDEFEQESQVSFLTGENLFIKQEGHGLSPDGTIDIEIEMNGEVPIVQAESKIMIEPFSERYIETNNKIKRTVANNRINIDGKTIPYTWDNKVKYRQQKHTNMRKRMVEKISTENIATTYDSNTKEIQLSMSTNSMDEYECPSGFEINEWEQICQDLDECEENRCHASQLCENTLGSYRCYCQHGYKSLGNGYRCLDINECLLDTHKCSHVCENLPGTYHCDCPAGMILADDLHTCLKTKDEHPLEDYLNNYSLEIDDSVTEFHYSVSNEECPTGYERKNNSYECTDIDECEDIEICTVNQKCLNTKGAYFCIPAPCPENYQRNIRTSSCVQSCLNNAHICSDNAEIAQIIQYKTLSLNTNEINLGEPMLTLKIGTFKGRPVKYITYTLLENSSDNTFDIFTRGEHGFLICHKIPQQNRVHRLSVIGNGYNSKRNKLLYTTKFIIYLYILE